jgi:hypothetical protein
MKVTEKGKENDQSCTELHRLAAPHTSQAENPLRVMPSVRKVFIMLRKMILYWMENNYVIYQVKLVMGPV